jgi:hypothetical protein
MTFQSLQAFSLLAVFLLAVLFAITALWYTLARLSQIKRRLKLGQRSRVFLVAAGFALLQLFREFWSPGSAHLLVQKADEDADEEGDGDPDSPEAHLHRQLRKIRRGEPVDRLVLRL